MQSATSMATSKRRFPAWRWRGYWLRMMATLSGWAATQWWCSWATCWTVETARLVSCLCLLAALRWASVLRTARHSAAAASLPHAQLGAAVDSSQQVGSPRVKPSPSASRLLQARCCCCVSLTGRLGSRAVRCTCSTATTRASTWRATSGECADAVAWQGPLGWVGSSLCGLQQRLSPTMPRFRLCAYVSCWAPIVRAMTPCITSSVFTPPCAPCSRVQLCHSWRLFRVCPRRRAQ